MARTGVLLDVGVGWSALYRLDLKESGYKVAWIETPPQWQWLLLLLQPGFDFAPRAPSAIHAIWYYMYYM
jgi:hypothetical protein